MATSLGSDALDEKWEGYGLLESIESPEAALRMPEDRFKVLVEAMRPHGVLPLFAWTCVQAAGFSLAGDGTREILHRELLRAKAATGLIFDEFERVLEVLFRAGHGPLVLKGPHLAQEYYPKNFLRPMIDLDLFYPEPAVAEKAFEALRSEGYGLLGEPVLADRWGLNWHLPALVWPGSSVPVEIHAGLLFSPFDKRQRRLSVLFSEPIPFEYQRYGLRGLCPECNVVYMLAHGLLQHVREPLKLQVLYDTRFILEKEGAGFSWDKLVRLAADSGLAPTTSKGLHRLRRCFPSRVPADVLTELDRAAKGGSSKQLSPESQVSEGVLLAIWNSGGLRDRVRAAVSSVFPSEPFLRLRYPEHSGRPGWWLYIYRWRDLAGRMWRFLLERLGGRGFIGA